MKDKKEGGEAVNDEEIIELFFSRDELAITSAQEKYGPLLLKVALKILGERSDAEECLNDAYLALWGSIPPERPQNLAAYCCKIVRNLSFKRLEYNLAQKRSARSAVPLEELEASLSGGEDFAAYENVDFSIAVNDFLKSLKPEMRVVFMKRYYMTDSVPEIASDLGFSESKVKSMLLRARKKFKSYLKGELK